MSIPTVGGDLRAARYPSADQLASDISRYLDHMPLTAYQETLLDRTQRFIQ